MRLFLNYNDKLYFRNRQEITPARHKPNNALCMEPNTSSALFQSDQNIVDLGNPFIDEKERRNKYR